MDDPEKTTITIIIANVFSPFFQWRASPCAVFNKIEGQLTLVSIYLALSQAFTHSKTWGGPKLSFSKVGGQMSPANPVASHGCEFHYPETSTNVSECPPRCCPSKQTSRDAIRGLGYQTHNLCSWLHSQNIARRAWEYNFFSKVCFRVIGCVRMCMVWK